MVQPSRRPRGTTTALTPTTFRPDVDVERRAAEPPLAGDPTVTNHLRRLRRHIGDRQDSGPHGYPTIQRDFPRRPIRKTPRLQGQSDIVGRAVRALPKPGFRAEPVLAVGTAPPPDDRQIDAVRQSVGDILPAIGPLQLHNYTATKFVGPDEPVAQQGLRVQQAALRAATAMRTPAIDDILVTAMGFVARWIEPVWFSRRVRSTRPRATPAGPPWHELRDGRHNRSDDRHNRRGVSATPAEVVLSQQVLWRCNRNQDCGHAEPTAATQKLHAGCLRPRCWGRTVPQALLRSDRSYRCAPEAARWGGAGPPTTDGCAPRNYRSSHALGSSITSDSAAEAAPVIHLTTNVHTAGTTWG